MFLDHERGEQEEWIGLTYSISITWNFNGIFRMKFPKDSNIFRSLSGKVRIMFPPI
jgi:hypothetical protein